MKFPRNVRIFRGQLEVAPFAAVFFLLVIFLALNSSFVFTPGIPLRLPEAAGLPGTLEPTVVVAVDASGNYYYENQALSPTQVETRLRAAAKKSEEPLTLVVQGDQDVTLQSLVHLALMARDAGIPNALLATRPAIFPRPPFSPGAP